MINLQALWLRVFQSQGSSILLMSFLDLTQKFS